jgi:3-methyladenine DNA glycosylase AlkD
MTRSIHPIQRDLRAAEDPKRAALLAGFFRTGPGEYGEGDRFLGVVVPMTRAIVKRHAAATSLADVDALLASPWHEERLAALVALVEMNRKSVGPHKRAIFDFYVANADRVNNWDLVDASAAEIFGPAPASLRTRLAKSSNLWRRRIAIVSTHHGIRRGDPSEAYRVADLLLRDEHDLIHKAVGWMLREAGKRCSMDELVAWLRERPDLPRTSLRYAIERFPPARRKAFLAGRFD